MNQAGLELLKYFEGVRLTAYKDAVGVWTVGYGHTSAAGSPKVFPGQKITQAQAEEILQNDLKKYEDAVKKAVLKPTTANQFAAMTSLCYNIGPGNFSASTLVKRFNAGDVEGASAAFMNWTKAKGKVLPGLVTRRKAEQKLFNTR